MAVIVALAAEVAAIGGSEWQWRSFCPLLGRERGGVGRNGRWPEQYRSRQSKARGGSGGNGDSGGSDGSSGGSGGSGVSIQEQRRM
eukprot:6180870-Pleurochrysis_carterae.AAC.1